MTPKGVSSREALTDSARAVLMGAGYPVPRFLSSRLPMPTQPNPRPLFPPILWSLLLGLSLALRVPGLFESLWFDEVYRTFVVLRDDIMKDLLLHDVHNPLYNAFMYG